MAAGIKRTKTKIGGVLVLTHKATGERITQMVEYHAIHTALPEGWEATYYGPGDVKASEIRLMLRKSQQ